MGVKRLTPASVMFVLAAFCLAILLYLVWG